MNQEQALVCHMAASMLKASNAKDAVNQSMEIYEYVEKTFPKLGVVEPAPAPAQPAPPVNP